jgi:hypothetical protein
MVDKKVDLHILVRSISSSLERVKTGCGAAHRFAIFAPAARK